MDPSSVYSWVTQSRKYMQSAHASARSVSLPTPGARIPHIGPSPRWEHGNFMQSPPPPQPGPSVDEPLDLTVKPGEGAPLDLTVSRSLSKTVNQLPSTQHNREYVAAPVRRSATTDSSFLNRREDKTYKPPVVSSPVINMPYLKGSPIDKPPPSVSPLLRCVQCHYVTINSVEFQRHRAYVHGSSTSHTEMSQPHRHQPPGSSSHSQTSDERLHCLYCGYQCDLLNTQAFYAHLKKHMSNTSQYVCFHCERVLPDQNILREHILVHRNLNHYVCSLCSVAFSKQSLFAAHMHRRHRSMDASGQPTPQSTQEAPLTKCKYRVPSQGSRSLSATPPSVSTLANLSPSVSNNTAADCTPPQTFGQCLAKQIEAAIHHHVSGGNAPSLSDVMFMKSEGAEADHTPPAPLRKSPLNLLTLLDRVVEQSLRSASVDIPPEKPNLKFTVTFSDDGEEEEEVKECDSTVVATATTTATNNIESIDMGASRSLPPTIGARDANATWYDVTSSQVPKDV